MILISAQSKAELSFELTTLELKFVVKPEQKRPADNSMLRESINHISAVLICEKLFMLYMKNKGTDENAHSCNLIQ